MATTAIWDVKGWLGKLVIYAENLEKTINPKYYEKQDMNNQETEALNDVIGYAMREDATVSEELKEHFVSGINCSINTARTEIMAVKKRYGKEDGIVAFHGYQSFAPNYILASYSSDELKELARLKKENRDLKDALEILKKAMNILNSQ
ncbi:relaxase/mobilization nuclease domain-containing protein [Thomasclavelia cocleata]|uniref:relaxase/mobilization nuclease domain-containing protein n=1 Tax=Thomasclavelia cocleata TaxID=69824 RepID=UPI002430B005|nr:hypothetical protein [Thomasclavelia cocleata]